MSYKICYSILYCANIIAIFVMDVVQGRMTINTTEASALEVTLTHLSFVDGVIEPLGVAYDVVPVWYLTTNTKLSELDTVIILLAS